MSFIARMRLRNSIPHRRLDRLQVTVPTNILLFGEYAILSRGGRGLSVAIYPTVQGTITADSRLTIEGVAAEEYRYVPHAATPIHAPQSWLGRLTEILIDMLTAGDAQGRRDLIACPYRLRIDSRSCFDEQGNKRGLGSSAALSILLAAMLLSLYRQGQQPSRRAISRYALAAHRRLAGGGSGYDIYASLYGGLNLFIGGAHPRQRPVALPWIGSLALLRGNSPVNSAAAVMAYRRWKEEHRDRWRMWQRENNRLVGRLLRAPTWDAARAYAIRYRDMQCALGDAIGYPAAIDTSHTDDIEMDASQNCPFVKAVGAGDELAVVFHSQPPSSIPMHIHNEGLQWS